MTIQFTTTSQLAVANGVKAVIYGAAGAGKTMLCATAPKPIIVSAESGLLSLSKGNIERSYGVNTPGVTYDMPVLPVGSMAQFYEAYKWCACYAGQQGFATLCIDSLSEICEQILKAAKVSNKDNRAAYGTLIEDAIGVIKAFRDLPGLNVYFTAKMEKDKDADGMLRFGPMLPGNRLPQDLPYLTDEVFHLGVHTDPTTQKTFRYLRTLQDHQYTAKDRSGALDPFEPANLTHVFHKILGVNHVV